MATAQEVKEIPLEQTPPRPATVLEFNGENFSVKVDPATSASSQRNPAADAVTNSFQQQTRFMVEQAISPFFAIIYRVEAGFKTQETIQAGYEQNEGATVAMLQSPALAWKPREGVEVRAAWEKVDDRNQNLASGQTTAWALTAGARLSERTALSLSTRTEERTGYSGEQTGQTSVKASLEHDIAHTPLRLVLGPGWQEIRVADGSQAMRAFLDSALIWTVDDWTKLTAGSNIAGSSISTVGDSLYLLLQHKVMPGAGFELKAALLRSMDDLPEEGFSISAQSTIAVAEALNAGIGLRYRMDQSPAVSQAGGETVLSLSINGSF